MDEQPSLRDEFSWVYPNAEVRKKIDPLALATEKNLKSIEVYLDHGDMEDDFPQQSNRVLYEELKSRGVHVQYHVGHGAHDYGYWGSRADDWLLFFAGKP